MTERFTPSKIVCVGRNYRAHAKELGNEVPSEPLLFLKPPSAVIADGEAIVLPRESQRVEHEGELAVVIGRRARRIRADEAPSIIAGYTVANDVTVRERPPLDAAISVHVNGAQRQRGYLRDMVFSIDVLVAYISDVMTLEPGDVILTGTPEGVGPLSPGDVVQVAIESVGTLTNSVRAEG
jgi:2-keto-4-pentenoate hydratase/2-oxohepta-3-ene-1,7-dioic acid hydratase in catechol pathway